MLQQWRTLTQTGFFVLFVIAPPLDLFRYDLNLGHFILLGYDWRLNVAAIQHGQDSAVINILLLGIAPILLIAAGFLFVAWRWGRIYCGWFCPHFSVVEQINKLMIRAIGKPSIWDKKTLPLKKPNRWYWLPTVFLALFFALIWSVSLLTYLLPPFEIYHNILNLQLTRNQSIFLLVATSLFCLDFLVTRHLFCRFGCAVGLFQSLAWMANRRAMVIAYDNNKARACQSCNNACDNACPMRLQPRTIKRRMFSCTECGECISACTQVQGGNEQDSLLHWVQGVKAEQLSEPPVGIPKCSSPRSQS